MIEAPPDPGPGDNILAWARRFGAAVRQIMPRASKDIYPESTPGGTRYARRRRRPGAGGATANTVRIIMFISGRVKQALLQVDSGEGVIVAAPPASHPPVIYFWPPWDLLADPISTPPALGRGGIGVGNLGIYIGSEEPTAEQLANGVAFSVNVRTGVAFYYRIATWIFEGDITVTLSGVAGSGTYSGHIKLVCEAVDYVSDLPLPLTLGAPALHGGWYGHDEDPPPWTFTPATEDGEPTDFPIGPISLRLGDVTSLPGPFPDGSLSFAPIAQLPFCSVGRARDEDNCLVTATLPDTLDGSFDGYGDHGFTFRLGTSIDVIGGGAPPVLTGAFTFIPTVLPLDSPP